MIPDVCSLGAGRVYLSCYNGSRFIGRVAGSLRGRIEVSIWSCCSVEVGTLRGLLMVLEWGEGELALRSICDNALRDG